MSSKAASSSSQLKDAMPVKIARVEEEVQTNETMEDLTETKDELERVRKTLAITQKDRDTWRRLLEECNMKQGE